MSDTDTKDGTVVREKTPITPVDATDVVPPELDSCSPLPDDAAKRSKKRLREVSVDVSAPKDDESAVPVEAKEVELPPKKNKLQISESTGLKETEPPVPKTPPSTGRPLLGTSPPHESKVRQIRKRVKDLNWKEARRRRSGSTGEADPQDDGPEAGDAASEGKPEEDDSSKSVSAKSDSEKEEVKRGGKDEHPTTKGKPDSPGEVAAGSPDGLKSTGSPEPGASFEPPLRTDIEDKHADTDLAPSSVIRLSDSCQGKRRRDDGDQNPREAKRVSPPPEKEKTTVKSESVKNTGFMAYASSASPFAAVKDAPNVFGSTNPPVKFGATSIPPPPPSSSVHSTPALFNSSAPLAPQASAPVTFGSSGFTAYASVASPFATATPSGSSPFGVVSTSGSKYPSRVARSKSPGKHANAFEPYTTRSGTFAAAAPRPPKKPRRGSGTNGRDGHDAGTGSGSASGSGDEAGDDESGSPTSFGDILSAKENKPDVTEEEKKVEFTEQALRTGEEDEITEYQVRAKLFAMAPPPISGWKERGVGMLKLNIHRKTGRARLVLRTDGVLRLVLNTNLFKGMNFEIAQDPRYVKFGLIVDKKVVLHTLRLGNVKHAEDLLEQVRAFTPGVSVTDGGPEV